MIVFESYQLSIKFSAISQRSLEILANFSKKVNFSDELSVKKCFISRADS